MITIRPDIQHLFTRESSVPDFLRIDCELARNEKHRRTGRFERSGRAFYIKTHDRFGWFNWLDELLRLRRPDPGARPEWTAIKKLESLNLPTLKIAAFGRQGLLPPFQRSFIITDEIAPAISLETFFTKHKNNAPHKSSIIQNVAHIAKTLHSNGLNHRDFYLCHFLLKPPVMLNDNDSPTLYLIDLHRLQIRKKTPPRWIIKDLAQLHYSALNLLTRTDMLRFLLLYFDTKKLTKKQKRLIPPILRKSNQIAAHDHKLRMKRT